MGATGSILGCSLDGINYGVMADADASVMPGILNEGIATSGDNIKKVTRQVGVVSGVVLDISNPLDEINLTELNDSGGIYTISFTKADGSVYSGLGWINLQSSTSQDGAATVDLIPKRKFELIPS